MKNSRASIVLLLLSSLAVSACGDSEPTTADTTIETGTSSVVTTSTPASSTTATVESSVAPTPDLLPLEIVEWNEYPYADLADPQNTDTRVEIVVRNPNDFPVKVNNDEDELRFLNSAGEVVYTNPSSTFYFWEGSWILGGETSAMSACVCFWTDGVELQEWASLELAAPLEAAEEFAYTTDVEVTLGEFFSLAEAHLGGSGFGAQITLVNSGNQTLESFDVRVVARDQSGKHVGVAIYGSFVPDFTNPEAPIEPGASGGGVVVNEINYVDGPLSYEVLAIGIPLEN